MTGQYVTPIRRGRRRARPGQRLLGDETSPEPDRRHGLKIQPPRGPRAHADDGRPHNERFRDSGKQSTSPTRLHPHHRTPAYGGAALLQRGYANGSLQEHLFGPVCARVRRTTPRAISSRHVSVHGTPVEFSKGQLFFRLSAFADRLLEGTRTTQTALNPTASPRSIGMSNRARGRVVPQSLKWGVPGRGRRPVSTSVRRRHNYATAVGGSLRRPKRLASWWAGHHPLLAKDIPAISVSIARRC